MSKKNNQSPRTTSLAYDRMEPRWALMEALLGGTETMREAGETYCPKHEEETDLSYQARLDGSVLYNMTEETLNTLVGKPFSVDMIVNDDVPDPIRGTETDPASGLLYDIDLQGNSLQIFCQNWFREGMAKALCHVLVDLPPPAEVSNADPNQPPPPRTLADDRREGRRPFWVLVKPEAVIFARAEVVEGREVLKHVRLLETYVEQDRFGEVCKQRIRVLEPGTVEYWEPDLTRKKDGEPEWVRTQGPWETGLDYIPMVTFYANREEFMVGKPPLLDLAHLNVTHWQSTSEQRHILQVARFPILACSGASSEDSDPIVIGPNRVLYNPDAAGRFYYVEHTGASIEAGRKDLEDLERQMEAYGAQFLQRDPGAQTATSKAINSADSSSSLASRVAVFEDAVAQALDYTAEMLGLTQSGGTVELLKTYNEVPDDGSSVAHVLKARELKIISRKAAVESLRQKGVLPEDFDAELDAEELEGEADDAMARAGFDLDPAGGQPKSPPPGGDPEGDEEDEDEEDKPPTPAA